jgi:heat shock protein HslJ
MKNRELGGIAFVAVVALLAGCATAKKEPPATPFIGTLWHVVLELPIAGEQPYMRFGDGRVEGFGGCNRFSAQYVQDSVGARAIAIRRIELDRRLCDASAKAAEAHMMDVLQSVSSYAVTANTLTMSGSGGSLIFRGPTPVTEEAKK